MQAAGSPTARGRWRHSHEHGIRGRHIVAAPFGEEERCERNQVHPREHAVAWVAQEGDEAGEAKRRSGHIDADKDLVAQKMVAAAFAYIAFVNVLEEVVGDEVV